MAQAETIPTTRRQFSKWLAAMAGAATVAPLCARADAQVSGELMSAANDLKSAYDADTDAFQLVHVAETAVAEWKARNREPNIDDPEFIDREDYISLFSKAQTKYWTRETAAKRQAKLGPAKKARLATQQVWFDRALTFSIVECSSMQDIVFKASMAAEYDTDMSTIAGAIVYDLLKLHKIDS